jgi:hypothetical protein
MSIAAPRTGVTWFGLQKSAAEYLLVVAVHVSTHNTAWFIRHCDIPHMHTYEIVGQVDESFLKYSGPAYDCRRMQLNICKSLQHR